MVVEKSWWESIVGILVKEELCESVVEIRRWRGRIMTMHLVIRNDTVDMCSMYPKVEN